MSNYKNMDDEEFNADVTDKIEYQNSDIYKISSLYNHYEKYLEAESSDQKTLSPP